MCGLCIVALAKPRWGRKEWEGRVIDVGRRVGDYVKVFQQKPLAVSCPLA